MLKARNKKVSIILVLAMMMTMFAGLGTVSASSTTYDAVSVPTLQSSGVQQLGITKVTIDEGTGLANGDVLTFSLPSTVTLPNGGVTGGVAAKVNGAAAITGYADSYVNVSVPGTIPGTSTPNPLVAAGVIPTAAVGGTGKSLDITFAGSVPGQSVFYIYWNYASLSGVDGDVAATVLSSNSLFPVSTVTLAKTSSSSGTQAAIKSVKSIGGTGTTDTITLLETITNSLKSNETIKLKLPSGFTWDACTTVPGHDGYVYNWAWTSLVAPTMSVDSDARILKIKMPTIPTGATKTGRIDFYATLSADSDAAMGDVVASLYSDLGNVTEQDITVATYGEYGTTLTAGTSKSLTAGKTSQKLGTFYVQENLSGSLIKDRNVKLTLPEGVKWSGEYNGSGTTGSTALYPSITQVKGAPANILTRPTPNATSNATTDSGRTLSFNIAANSTSANKLELKDYLVDVAPNFSGDIKITASGTSGITGEVVVGTVAPAVEITASAKPDLKIGERDQVLGDITIKEGVKGAIAYKTDDVWVDGVKVLTSGSTTNIDLVLPSGTAWASGYPTVTVTEGDVEFKTASMSKPNNQTIRIPVKSESSKVSTVVISGLKVNVDRTVPEGDFSVSIAGTAIDETSGSGYPFAQFEGLDVAAGDVITPAPSEGTTGSVTGQFKINSNIYEVDGVSKVMDAAPYIKNGRTYVPLRYVGLALGVADSDIVWDATAQTATLTLGSTVEVFTIGSTTYTVNGEAKTMDVAPEINNGRTMLPARYVAEGFGYVVGWDASTGTVLLSK